MYGEHCMNFTIQVDLAWKLGHLFGSAPAAMSWEMIGEAGKI